MELYFTAVETVAETWEVVQGIPNYEAVVGEILFRQYVSICVYTYQSCTLVGFSFASIECSLLTPPTH